MKIREFKQKDYEQVVKILKSNNLFNKNIDNYKVRLRVHKNNPSLFLVAEEDKKIVGTILGQGDGRIGFIWSLAILPKYQSRGIGKALMKEIEKRLKKKGCVSTILFTKPKMKKAVRMYKKFGYQKNNVPPHTKVCGLLQALVFWMQENSFRRIFCTENCFLQFSRAQGTNSIPKDGVFVKFLDINILKKLMLWQKRN